MAGADYPALLALFGSGIAPAGHDVGLPLSQPVMMNAAAAPPPPLEVSRAAPPRPAEAPPPPRGKAPVADAAALAAAAAKAAAEVPRCHLHKKPQQSCKFCQRVLNAKKEAEATAATAKKIGATAEKRRTFSCSPLLKEQVLNCSYYRTLLNFTNLEELVEEIQQFATDTLDVYRSALEPSCFMCGVYRLYTLEHSEEELRAIIDHAEYNIVRCAGFLFLRYTLPPEQLWERLEEFVLDDAKLPDGLNGLEVGSTVGEYVEGLLLKDKYFNTPLPRIPAAIWRKLEEHLAPLSQYRKRAKANQRHFRDQRGPRDVEALINGAWRAGRVTKVIKDIPSRLRVRVALTSDQGDDQAEDLVVHVGHVVIRGNSEKGGDRGRGRSPDWSRYKGKSAAELLEEIRERQRSSAVCTDRKEYAKRPLCFEGCLAIKREQGSAEARLTEEETRIVTSGSSSAGRRRPTEEEEEEFERKRRRRTEEEEERQRKLKDIFEKYGQQRSAGGRSTQANDLEGPDKMRLG